MAAKALEEGAGAGDSRVRVVWIKDGAVADDVVSDDDGAGA